MCDRCLASPVRPQIRVKSRKHVLINAKSHKGGGSGGHGYGHLYGAAAYNAIMEKQKRRLASRKKAKKSKKPRRHH